MRLTNQFHNILLELVHLVVLFVQGTLRLTVASGRGRGREGGGKGEGARRGGRGEGGESERKVFLVICF